MNDEEFQNGAFQDEILGQNESEIRCGNGIVEIMRFNQPSSSYIADSYHLDLCTLSSTEDLLRREIQQEDLVQTEENFWKSKNIIVPANLAGLGDAIILLKHTLLLAKKFTDKQFTVLFPNSLLELFKDRLLPNIFLTNIVTDQMISNDTFILGSYFLDQITLLKDKNILPPDIVKELLQQHRISLPINRAKLKRIMPEDDSDSRNVNHLQRCLMLALDMLGITIDSLEVNSSPNLFDSASWQDLPHENSYVYDYFIAPDAKEGREYLDEGNSIRCCKSLPVSGFDLFFERISKLSPPKRCAVLVGTAHRAYCLAIIESARKYNIDINAIEGDFSVFVRTIAASRKIITKDSVTAHLGCEVVEFCNSRGKSIRMDSLYNGVYLPPSTYTLLSNDPRVRNIVYTHFIGDNAETASKTKMHDMQSIVSSQLVEILADI